MNTRVNNKKKKQVSLLKDIIKNRKLIIDLAKNDFKTRYAGSYLGIIWAFIQPLVTILIYWFVFSVGLKANSIGDYPYVLWLIAGLIPWFFFQEALQNGTNCLIEYSYLVKKVVFRIDVLPMVKVLSASFVHIAFMIIMLVIYMLNGFWPSVYWLQLIYCTVCMFTFVLGLTFATSAIVVFFRDLGQLIGIILQIGMWMTPIMWDSAILPASLRWVLKINPMYYIIQQYRNAMLYHVPFWSNINLGIYFWVVTIALFVIGINVFRRLKIHFADVL